MTREGSKRNLLVVLCALSALIFGSLGVWQVNRLRWKLELISRVDARIAAPPVPLPPVATWATLEPAAMEYRRVTAEGEFDHRRETLVDALTERGAGAWVMTPLRTGNGIVLVNRGFVPRDAAEAQTRTAGQVMGRVKVTGLIRRSEPEGRILRPNRPALDRWYSRDVAAIARARKLGPVAPFFIDADSAPNPGGAPVGGLTVIHFRNAHLVYAVTWFALSGLALAGLVLVLKPRSKADGTT